MTPRRTRQALCVFLAAGGGGPPQRAVSTGAAHAGRQYRCRAAAGAVGAAGPKAASSVVAERPAAAKDVPDKRATGGERANPGLQQGWTSSETTGAAAASQKPDAASPDTIRAIQRELRQKGYGNLSSDGTLRPQTRAAIMAYAILTPAWC